MHNPEFFNVLDYSFIFLTLFSCLVGFFRGIVRDFLGSCAWVGSGFLSAFISPYLTHSLMAKGMDNIWLAKISSILLSYFVVLITLLLVVNAISERVRNTPLSSVDRALGMLFGFVRGIVILITITLLAILFEIPDRKIQQIEESKVTPYLFDIAARLMPKIVEIPQLKPSTETFVDEEHEYFDIPEEEIENAVQDEKDSKINRLKQFILNQFSKFEQKMKEEAYNEDVSSREAALRRRREQLRRNPDAKFGCMSLMKARATRRKRKKAEKIRRDIMRQLDKGSL